MWLWLLRWACQQQARKMTKWRKKCTPLLQRSHPQRALSSWKLPAGLTLWGPLHSVIVMSVPDSSAALWTTIPGSLSAAKQMASKGQAPLAFSDSEGKWWMLLLKLQLHRLIKVKSVKKSGKLEHHSLHVEGMIYLIKHWDLWVTSCQLVTSCYTYQLDLTALKRCEVAVEAQRSNEREKIAAATNNQTKPDKYEGTAVSNSVRD